MKFLVHALFGTFLGMCPARLRNVAVCTLEPGHGGRHRGKAGRRGWPVEWE